MAPQWTWYAVPVAEIVKYLDPLSGTCWSCDPITPEEVNRAIAEGDFESTAWDIASNNIFGLAARNFHIR